MYTKERCVQCDMTKRLMSQLGVEFVEEDAMDEGNLLAFKELGFLAAPVVAVGESRDDMWSGFRPDRIKEIAQRLNKEEK
ncbi:glutaredoxin domain-containing protein [Leucobacter allii]